MNTLTKHIPCAAYDTRLSHSTLNKVLASGVGARSRSVLRSLRQRDARGPRPIGGRKFYPYYWAYGEIPAADPIIDPDVKCSGTGSLRLTTQCWTSVATHRDGDKYVLSDKTNLPSLSANTGGFPSLNFSNDYSVFVGAGQKVYYQWRERCDDTSMRVKHFGATGWSGPWAVAVNADVITAQTAQNINAGHYVRLDDANGKIVGNHSIADARRAFTHSAHLPPLF